ncbi:hypothetical protein NEF87_001289 [Candidatus Lokiarchaeum ossiferum]|uniref:Uncharacterized protein n=1 Tax=Candidatus Lokiarchaeum ossiferum TaxID=2951803 RepID=A0ABY6HR03_9ARCH|nr:hypothetical protein NEF87_001289 [Candidatus Lokiarchaeum sp. B-35]
MVKTKQLTGILFFLVLYEIFLIYPSGDLFGIIPIRGINPSGVLLIYYYNSFLFYLAPAVIFFVILYLIGMIKAESSVFWKIFFSFLSISLVFIETIHFLFNCTPGIIFSLNIDWISLVENSGQFGAIGGSAIEVTPLMVYFYVKNLLSYFSLFLSILLIVMILVISIKSWIIMRREIRVAQKVKHEIRDNTNEKKRILFTRPMNMILIKQKLHFFRSCNKKDIISQDFDFFSDKRKKALLWFTGGILIIIIWLIIVNFFSPFGIVSRSVPSFSGYIFEYYSLWLMIPFRFGHGIAIGYCFTLLLQMKSKFNQVFQEKFEDHIIKQHSNDFTGQAHNTDTSV